MSQYFNHPRVTEIISATDPPAKRQSLIRWQKKMEQVHGVEGAELNRQQILDNGTRLHTSIENYLKGKPEDNPHEWLKNVVSYLNIFRETNLLIEQRFISKAHGFTGKPDCVSDNYKGKVTLFDWTTSSKPKRRAWLDHKFLQAGAYTLLLQENTSIEVEQLVVIVILKDNAQQFIESDPNLWRNKFLERLKLYKQLKEENKLPVKI